MRRTLMTMLLVAVTLLAPAGVQAAEPPNQNDPCSRGGRNSCATTGIGSYETYRFGLRWFGDYRRAVAGVDGPTFCLDLRFWYPGRNYRYALRTSTEPFRNRARRVVSDHSLRRMSYAIFNHGRSGTRAGQAAVMLYVHRLMDDGAPGEVDPSALGPAVEATYRRISRNAERFAGPYRLEANVPSNLAIRRASTMTLRVIAASGAAVPNVRLDLSLRGARNLPRSVSTGADGVARIAIAPDDARNGLRGTVRSELLAADRPAIYVPQRADAARNGQRLAAAATTRLQREIAADVAPAQIAVTTTATPATIAVGEQTRDKVLISGAPGGWRADAEVRLYGPARTRESISCSGEPIATTTYRVGGGPSTTPPFVLARPGYYAYQLVIPSTDDVLGVTTPCPEPSEIVKVETQPSVVTQVSAPAVDPGAAVTDSALVSGLAGETVTVNATLHGPYPAADKMTCEGPPIWSGSFVAAADGTYVTDPVTLTVPGYYTYRESIAPSEFVRAVHTPCAEASETTIVRGRPAIVTQVSAQETAPGSAITDSVAVSGLGALSAVVNVELWGPFETREAIRCEGTPFAATQMPVNGDGTYTTPPVTLTRAGWYTYRESIAPTPAFEGTVTACGEVSETTFARARPAVTTIVSNAVTRPGARIFDRIRVSGIGQTPVRVEVRLWGPYPSRAAMTCEGTAYWKGSVTATGDGEVRSPAVRLSRAGFYTYTEHVVETPTVAPTQTPCGEVTETSLAIPLILTGRGDRVVRAGPVPVARAAAPAPPPPPAASAAIGIASASAAPVRPTQVAIGRLGIGATVYGVDIDTRTGALAVPQSIDRVGWWRDGGAPGAARGTILLAGHVDSARRGAGAFYRLREARRGDTVTVRSDDGRTRSYRVILTRRVRKGALPTGIFTPTGPRRLVLVTCGGPFDTRRGSYRDNIVVSAVPR